MFYALAFGTIAIVAALRYPPIAVCIYLLFYDFVSIGECFPFLKYGSNVLPLILLLICYIGSLYRIGALYGKGRATRPLLIATGACLVCGIYPLYSLAASHRPSKDYTDFVTYIVESGPLLVLPVIAYGKERLARVLMAGTLALQVGLAFLILHLPVGILGELNAANYHSYAPTMTSIDATGNILRAVGQFSTPIQLGAYGTACLGVGLYLLKKGKDWMNRLLAVFFLGFGCWGEYVSFTRGMMFAAVFAIVLSRFPGRGWRGIALSALAVAVFFWVGQAALEVANPAVGIAVARHLSEVTNPQEEGITYRLTGLENAAAIINRDPAFGLGSTQDVMGEGAICHFYPGWFAAMYGLPAGLVILVLFWYAIKTDTTRTRVGVLSERLWSSAETGAASVFSWTAVSVLSTNFMGGRALIWIMLGFGVLRSIELEPLSLYARKLRELMPQNAQNAAMAKN